MFEMQGIEKRFGAVVALKGASLQTSPGEIRALLGSNGSGKSTMIKVLAGLYEPNGGEILFDGKPVRILSGVDSRRHGIATAFQELSLIPTMSVVDNILLGNEPLGKLGLVDRKISKQKILELLKRFHIDCDPDAYVQTLMPSTQAMLEVAKAVSLKPRLLLLDEVTSTLHYDEIQVLFEIMRELKQEGVAIIYVTHRMNEIFEICDAITVMRNGETVTQGTVSEFTLNDIVFHMTGQRPESSSERGTEAGATEGEPVLKVSNLEVYPKVWDVSMKAYRGEIIGIGGLQGQGQPEFIRALLGAEKISGGTMELAGKTVRFKSPTDAVLHEIGFVSGDRNREAIFPVRSISENITAGKIAKGNLAEYMTKKSIEDFSNNAVSKYNIKIGGIYDSANSLSGGNQQKLVIARWIAMNPTLLLLDDPTKGVDIHSRREIQKTLRQCANDGMTVIISSSENEELLEFSDRIYVFYEGYISDVLTGEQKTADRLVAAMMGTATMEEPLMDIKGEQEEEKAQNASSSTEHRKHLAATSRFDQRFTGESATEEVNVSEFQYRNNFDKFRKSPAFTGFVLFCAAILLNALIQGPANFFSPRSINTLFTTNIPFLLVVMAQSVLLISGTLDVSCGIQLALVNVVTIMTVQEWGIPFAAGCVLGIGAALVASLVCWVCVSVFRLPDLLASYALTFAIRGVNVLIMNVPQGKVEKVFYKAYDSLIFGFIPAASIALVIVLLIWLYAKRTKFGIYIYAVGANRQNAFAAGINPVVVQFQAFMLKGLFVGIAGICLTLMTSSGNPIQAEDYGIRSLAACIIGGLSFGGWGTMACGIFGGGFLIIIQNTVYYFFNMLYNLIPDFSVTSYWHNFISDIIIFLGLLMTIVTAKGQREALQINVKDRFMFRRREANAK